MFADFFKTIFSSTPADDDAKGIDEDCELFDEDVMRGGSNICYNIEYKRPNI